jgi:conjugal transfer/entry exclusion protein
MPQNWASIVLMKFDSQDDEYLASLQADQEKELKALQEAEVRHQEETAAREAAIEKEKQEEEERRKKKLEEEVQFRYILSGS